MNDQVDFKIIRPVKYDITQYNEAREIVIETFKNLEGINSIY